MGDPSLIMYKKREKYIKKDISIDNAVKLYYNLSLDTGGVVFLPHVALARGKK